VIKKEASWARWAGEKTDVVAAAELAQQTLNKWDGQPPKTSVTVELRDLTEQTSDLETLARLRDDELAGVKGVLITISSDPQAWSRAVTLAEREGVKEEELPAMPNSDVRLRITRSFGLSLEVWGDDAVAVEGLRNSMKAMLGRKAPLLHRIDVAFVAFLLILPLAVSALYLGVAVPQWIDLADANDEYDPWEVVGLVVGLIFAALIPLTLWRAFPRMELLPDAGKSRYRRLRQAFLSILSVVVLGVAVS
jgi:hypothetical protein